jgi:predicted amidophosphoribosyltransferase
LAQILRQHGLRGQAVMAVPLHSRRLGERGYNQSGLLAQNVARQLLLPDWSIYLKRLRATDRQSAVANRFGRAVNLAGAFGLAGRLPGGRAISSGLIILIDDILTTGATLTAAAAPLWAAGYAVAGLVVASDSPWNGQCKAN